MMNKLIKLLVLILILIIASILGGIYGIVHDQITYTISEEYYTKFKFIQFGLESWEIGENIGTDAAPELKLHNPRFGVSVIGVLATWWVGMIIGVILGLVGLLHKSGKEMFKITMKAAFLTLGIAFVFGIIGAVFGKVFLVNYLPNNLILPENVINQTNFIIVGSIHTFGYLGGLIGMIVSIIYSIRKREK